MTDSMRILIGHVLEALAKGTAERGGPVPAGEPDGLARWVKQTLGEPLPQVGTGASEALDMIIRILAYGAADPADPRCAAHLHCPPLPVAVAADWAVSMLNPSLDSWDQAPAAVTLERELIGALAELAGYDGRASGTVTTGGSESNLMGLMLARDQALGRSHGAVSAARDARIFCSELAHFSVQRAAALLGLGESAVRPVAVDARQRMSVRSLESELNRCEAEGGIPVAVVATAGTTDFGSIDPLRQVTALARRHGAWIHVDAAYGGMALCSDRLAPLLDGLDAADSISIDMHKLGWVPAAAGVFLVRERAALVSLERRAAYLNPEDDEDAGYVGLLGSSMRTTRRPDCVKMLVTLRALGRGGLGAMVDHCHDLAHYAAERIGSHPKLELIAPPVLTTVVFRVQGTDHANAELRRKLLREGIALVGRTELAGRVHLKLTLLNPHATRADVDEIVQAVARMA
ncbi:MULTISPECIES: pyridoxal phosphate-dependent decarboxylase family protein [unclassified Nonomuraea]